MRAGFGFPRYKRFFKALRRGGVAALAGLLFAILPLKGVDAQSPTPPSHQGAPTKPKPAAKKPVTRAPAKKATPAKPAASPKPAANPKPAAGPKPAPPALAPPPQRAPDEPKAAATPPGRAPVDVDIDTLKPYNLPPASREKMHLCGDEWRKLKIAGQAIGQTWRLFAEKCLLR